MLKNKHKQSAANSDHKTLKRPIHKRVMLHPAYFLLMLMVGVLMIGATYYKPVTNYADSLNVTASVLNPTPLQPALITSLINGQTINYSPYTVSGTCPYNTYVKLSRNGNFSGVAICDISGFFNIETDLTPGDNVLQVQDYNFSDVAGPTSDPLTISYTPPVVDISPTTTTYPTQEAANSPSDTSVPSYDNSGIGPELITSQYSYNSANVGQQYTWQVNLTGGTPPYIVNVSWGDGTSSSLIFKTDPTFQIGHDYSTVGSYNIIISSVDTNGVKAVIQIAAAINHASQIAPSTTTSSIRTPATPLGKLSNSTSTVLSNVHQWLWIIWPFYGVVLLMAISFWLGEREQYQQLFNRGARRTKRAH
jgi:hypothetical protein